MRHDLYIYQTYIYIRYNSCATYNICIHPFYSSCVWKTCLIYIRYNSSVTWKMSIHPIDLSSVYGIWLVCVCIYTYQTWFMCDLYVCIYIYHTWFMCDMKDLHSPLAVILSHMICMYHTWFVCTTHDLYVSLMICLYQKWFVRMRLMWYKTDVHPWLPFISPAYIPLYETWLPFFSPAYIPPIHYMRHDLYVSEITHMRNQTSASIVPTHSVCMRRALYVSDIICVWHDTSASCATWYVSIHLVESFYMYETCLIYIRHDLCATWNMCMHPLYSSYEAWLVCITRNSFMRHKTSATHMRHKTSASTPSIRSVCMRDDLCVSMCINMYECVSSRTCMRHLDLHPTSPLIRYVWDLTCVY